MSARTWWGTIVSESHLFNAWHGMTCPGSQMMAYQSPQAESSFSGAQVPRRLLCEMVSSQFHPDISIHPEMEIYMPVRFPNIQDYMENGGTGHARLHKT